MYRIVVEDTGLHPWEIDKYTLTEIMWQLHGSRTRHAQLQYGMRQIWVYVHNTLAKSKYRTPEQVHKVWPLYTDKIKAQDSPEDMLSIYREMKAKLENKNSADNGAGTGRDKSSAI